MSLLSFFRAIQFPARSFFSRCLLASVMLFAANITHAKPVEAEGELEVLIEDHAEFARTRHFLKTDKGRIELQFKGKAPDVSSGAKLRVKGEQTNNVMYLSDSGATSLAVTAAAPLPNTFGEQKVAVLLVNFQDDVSQPYTVAQANDMVFNQTSNFMRENSFQKTWITGNSYGWLTLPMASTCVTSDISTAAKQMASSAGLDLTAYNRFVYVFPRNAACVWAGVGTVGGTTSDVWINGRLDLKVVAHEFGHNFGLQHSHSNDCDTTPIGSACTTYDYGDVADTMGANTAGHFNAFQKERLGWLNSGAQPTIAIASASGSYQIGAYETATVNAKALKILKSTDPVTAVKSWYYIEYRQPIGFDAVLTSLYQSNLVKGVLIRTGTDGDRNSSYLLDMTPNTVPTFDMTDAALIPGQVFTDSAAGVMIAVTGVDTNQATVSVTLSASSVCVRANPGVTVTGGGSTVAAGAAVNYSTSITNNDSAACSASVFNLQSILPAGWVGGFTNLGMSLIPGASGTTTLTVTSSASTGAGSYTVGVGAANNASPSNVGSASASYVVAAATLATTVTTNKAVYGSNESVIITANVSAGGKPAANASVSFKIIKPNGSALIKTATTNTSGIASTIYRLSRKEPKGAWQVQDNASYLGTSANAIGNFSVQ
jgi:Gametolysin peptidase M11/NPCBM-associated, NEW3 domain of alpha-galactosidase